MKKQEIILQQDGYSLVKQVSPSNVYYCVFHGANCIINTYSKTEAEQVFHKEVAKFNEKKAPKPEPLPAINPKPRPVKKPARKK